MNARKPLAFVTTAIGLAGIAVFAGMLGNSLAPSARARNGAEVALDLSTLSPGKVEIFHVWGRPLLVLRPNESQRQSIVRLDAHVADRRTDNYVPQLDAYVYWGYATNRGCDIEERPPQASNLRDFMPAAEWLGGYWSPYCDLSYDYAGRMISTYEFTFNGYNLIFPNLSRPKLRFVGSEVIVQML